MNMDISLLLAIINTAASIATVCIAVFGIRIGKGILFKNEKVYGKEAEERYEALTRALPDSPPSCAPFEGGNIIIPQFTVDRLRYDPHTMPPEWKGAAKIIRYYYKEDSQTMVKCWRLK